LAADGSSRVRRVRNSCCSICTAACVFFRAHDPAHRHELERTAAIEQFAGQFTDTSTRLPGRKPLLRFEAVNPPLLISMVLPTPLSGTRCPVIQNLVQHVLFNRKSPRRAPLYCGV
jgi:hypothetical protein